LFLPDVRDNRPPPKSFSFAKHEQGPMLHLLSRWFEPVTPPQEYRRSDYLLLLLILAVGTWIRFWGLGNVGLHGDEETMAMPAMSVLEQGQPLLPSGMYYSRAHLNIYLMSASVWLFGESEWAFRLPSAIVGSLAPLAAFFMGRRFLPPQFNLAFVGTIAFLPALVVVSQTARMYAFFVTCLTWFGACLFRWERDGRLSSFLLALLAWSLALHFHTLAIFAAPLFLFPGLVQGSWRRLIKGASAVVLGYLAFDLYDRWLSSKYPERSERPPRPDQVSDQMPVEWLASGNEWLLVVSVVAAIGAGALLLLRVGSKDTLRRSAPILLILIGLLAMTVLHYHVGAALLGLGLILWIRRGTLPNVWLVLPLAVAGTIVAAHLALLVSSGDYHGRAVMGALIGTPSVWPTIRFLEYSPAAGVIYGAVLLLAAAVFAKGQRLPVHFLFFAMAVWAPLFGLGLFEWNVPPRYAIGQLVFFLMCVFAGLAFVFKDRGWMGDDARLSNFAKVLVAALTLAVINPVALGRVANPGYELYPDHKGAAEYIRSLNLGPEAILIAEDVLQQAYYLGRVDYSLRPALDARRFSTVRDGQWVDQYTGAIVIKSGKEFAAVLDASGGRPVYVIGSGENFVNGERVLRGRGIAEVLESDRLEVVYEGRDGKTRVWRLRP